MKEVFDGTVSLLTDGFGLCPFMLNRTEVGRIGGEIFKGMTGLMQGLLNISPFMESGVIEEDDGGWGQLGQEDVLDPGQKDIRIDTAFKKTDRQELEAKQGTNDVGAALGVPIKASVTALPDGGVL